MVSCAQNLEDIVLWRVLGHVEGGTYVDVGAADPDVDSVTRNFYDRGWSGLNIEPLPQYVARLRSDRPRDITIDACAGNQSGRLELTAVADTGLSTLSSPIRAELERDGYTIETIETRVETLDDLLVEAGFEGREIHFLKIDVEGFEQEVLEGLDLTRWRPWVLVVEATHPRSATPTHTAWEAGVLASGYIACLFDGLNRFYLSLDHDDLAEQLSYPACVLDHPFVSAPHGQLLADHLELQASADYLQAELARVLAGYAQLEETHAEALLSYGRLEETHAEALRSYGRLEAELTRTVASYERVDEELASVTAKHESLERASETLRQGVREMQREVEGLRHAVDVTRAAERALHEVTTSTSWKITAPLRRGIDVVRRLR